MWDNISLCASVKLSQMVQGLSATHLSSPICLSRHLAHLSCKSNEAIICPHEPRLCPFLSPGEAIILEHTNEHKKLTIYPLYNRTKIEKVSLKFQAFNFFRAKQKEEVLMHTHAQDTGREAIQPPANEQDSTSPGQSPAQDFFF